MTTAIRLPRVTTPARLALIVALAVLLAGIAYAAVSSPPYVSNAQLVLTPDTSDPAEASSLLESFQRSGTIGTFVELYASADTLRVAGDPPVTITVRAVPDSRVMRIGASGARDAVRDSLSRVLAAGRQRESTLRDLWTTQVLERPSAAEQGRPSRGAVLLATLLLAVLASGFTYVLLRRGVGTTTSTSRR